MTNVDWLSVTGALSGLVGAITGIAGAVMGYVAYKRSEKLKALDLRLELRKAENELQDSFHSIEPLMRTAKASHEALSAAIGMFRSGAMEAWTNRWNEDARALEELRLEIPATDFGYDRLSPDGIEDRLISVHALQLRTRTFIDFYAGTLTADDKRREQLVEDNRAARQLRAESSKPTPRG